MEAKTVKTNKSNLVVISAVDARKHQCLFGCFLWYRVGLVGVRVCDRFTPLILTVTSVLGRHKRLLQAFVRGTPRI